MAVSTNRKPTEEPTSLTPRKTTRLGPGAAADPPIPKQQFTTLSLTTTTITTTTPSPTPTNTDTQAQLARISASRRTAHEKRVWALLCQIPPGRVSTYGILAAALRSSPRAVGNALRRNPFAPDVPCHRVVAAGGALGGFKGQAATRREGEGTTLAEKRRLLRGEGVRFDAAGRVVGSPFEGFVVA